MSLRYIVLLATAAAAATIGLAPVAAAVPSGPINQCTSTGNSTVCHRHLAHGGFPPAVPVPPISGGPHALRQRLTLVTAQNRRVHAVFRR